MRVRFLGTSTSYGVPVIGCRCATCTSTDPRNWRTRASVYVETDEGIRLLIDSGPEVRLQALWHGVTRIDAVLYTHFHADHTAGIDDLKAFNAALGAVLPCFGDAATGASLRERFAYAFTGTRLHTGGGWHMRLRYILKYNSTNVRFLWHTVGVDGGLLCCTFFRAALSFLPSLFRSRPLQKTFTWIPAMVSP